MWHYDVEHDGSRSEDFQPTIIKSEWCKTNAFIFLGEKQNRERIDYQRKYHQTKSLFIYGRILEAVFP